MICETVYVKKLPKTKTLNTSSDAYNLVKGFIKGARQERLIVITLNVVDAVIGVHLLNIGTEKAANCSTKEIFYKAIIDNATSIIICHNHTDGIVEPSRADIELADKYFKAGVILGILVKDNMVISEYGFSSIIPNVEEFRKE
jgi:DNA repair protein RadC